MNKFKDRFGWLLFLSILCGLAAGLFGAALTSFYSQGDLFGVYSDVNLADLNANRSNLIIRDAKKVVVNQDLKISETVNSLKPSLIGFFREIPTSSPESLKMGYYKLDEPSFSGLVITADGWVAASLPAEIKASLVVKDYVGISSERRIYQVDKVSEFKNLPGDLVFFHLVGATNLAVKKIVPRSELSLGQTALVIKDFDQAILTSWSAFQKTPAVSSSDSLNARLSLSDEPGPDLENSFVFNLAGDLVAVISSDREIVPAFSYNPYWQSFLKKTSVVQPYFGVNYLDLSVVKAPSLSLDKGAWLYPTTDEPAVVKGSPAQQAGFKAGDVITWVDNQEINASSDLADVLATHNPGDTVTITYLRAGVQGEAKVKLGELK